MYQMGRDVVPVGTVSEVPTVAGASLSRAEVAASHSAEGDQPALPVVMGFPDALTSLSRICVGVSAATVLVGLTARDVATCAAALTVVE